MRLPDELLASLDDGGPEASLVAADWLIAQGEPWGDFITAQCRLEGATDPSVFMTFRERMHALLHQHGLRWLGAPVSVAWQRGFVERLELEDLSLLPSVLASDVGGLARDFGLTGAPAELERAVAVLVRAKPRRLRGVTLRSASGLSEPVEDGPRGHRPRRRSVGLSSTGSDRPGGAARVLDGSGLEGLQRLEVHGLPLDWRFEAGPLRWLSVSDAPTPALDGWLASAPRTLERLELLQCDVAHEGLARLVDAQWALRVLHLEDDLPDDLARWLADSPVIAQLEHLALGGPMTDDGLDALLVRFARFSRLKSIVLYGGRFGATIKRWAFKQLPQLSLQPRRPGPTWPGHPHHGIRLWPPPGP